MGHYADSALDYFLSRQFTNPSRKQRKKRNKMPSKTTLYLTGKIYWAKVLGNPRPNYSKDGNEWTFEFEPNAEGVKALKNAKLADRLKDKYEDRGRFLTLRKAELAKDGKPNTPIRVYDNENQAWPAETLIGNGSVVDVKLDVRDYGPGKKQGVYPIAIRVTELVPYVSSEFGAMDNDAKPEKAASKPAPRTLRDELDDDLPF
jgi:hypothetical protein